MRRESRSALKFKLRRALRRGGRPHADATGGSRAGFSAMARFGDPREQRGGMPVIAHAEHGHVERPRNAGERLPGRDRAEVRRGRGVLEPREARLRRRGP